MPHPNPRRRSRQSTCHAQQAQRWRHQPGLPFAHLPPAAVIEQALPPDTPSGRRRPFTAVTTLWVFLSQVLDPDHSCRQAVARFLAWLVGQGRPAGAPDTGAYGKARQRLPEGLLTRLLRQTGSDLEARSPADWRWHRRRVRLVDGPTVSMPDTPANQRALPQPRTQRPGLGFPIARLLVVFSLSVGTVREATLNPYKGKETGEATMLRALVDQLAEGDLLVGDRCYANYWLIALARKRGLDVVFRQHQRRRVDFRTGRRLGRDDHLITWAKPARPAWMDAATWAALPDTLILREIRVRVPEGKCRTRAVVVVTTLVDATHYAKAEVQALYRRRWEAEIHLRALKQTVQMDVPRCGTPAMIRKEVWAHLLIDNLRRTPLAEAAEAHDLKPWPLSFKGTLQTVNAFGGMLPAGVALDPARAYPIVLEAVASHRVGQRPDRYEPRRIKRRPKPHRLLQEPRAQARARFARQGGAGALTPGRRLGPTLVEEDPGRVGHVHRVERLRAGRRRRRPGCAPRLGDRRPTTAATGRGAAAVAPEAVRRPTAHRPAQDPASYKNRKPRPTKHFRLGDGEFSRHLASGRRDCTPVPPASQPVRVAHRTRLPAHEVCACAVRAQGRLDCGKRWCRQGYY